MKKLKLIAPLIVSGLLTLTAFCASQEAIDAAKELYTAGLMKGNSDTFSVEALELDRPATRTEIAITITRLLGKESKALYQQNPHPFCDVPDWASHHIGWLYESYLVNGVSDTLFGSNEVATTRQFCTMLLRVLGYSDAKGDFSYENATEAAKSIGLITQEEAATEILYRSNMALISRRALSLPLRNSNRTLSQKLREDRAITKNQYDLLNPVAKSALDVYFTDYTQTLPTASAYAKDDIFVIQMHDNIGSYGLRVFYTSDTTAVPTELPIENSTFGFVKSEAFSPFKWDKKDTVFNVYGLSGHTGVRFKIVDSSSEGVLYEINGVSPTIEVKPLDEAFSINVSFDDYFKDVDTTLPGGTLTRTGDGITVNFDSPVPYYGLRAVYTSDSTTYPKILPMENAEFGFTKGTPDWGCGGKIHSITLHGVDGEENMSVCIVDTSSEGALFQTYGVSSVIKE